jgi:CMP/dCMP kinase
VVLHCTWIYNEIARENSRTKNISANAQGGFAMDSKYLAITINHQLGSGGAYLGQKLAERLGLPFIDRDILKKVAEQLNLAEGVLNGREERLSTFWQSFMRVSAFTDPVGCLSFDNYSPTDQELFRLESDYIGRIADKSSAVFLGRCGSYILRDHPNHISIFVHAALPDRIKRIQQLYCLGAAEAKKLIETNDRERTAYMRAFTHQDWLDARWYDLCINTSRVGLDKAVDLALALVQECVYNKEG